MVLDQNVHARALQDPLLQLFAHKRAAAATDSSSSARGNRLFSLRHVLGE